MATPVYRADPSVRELAKQEAQVEQDFRDLKAIIEGDAEAIALHQHIDRADTACKFRIQGRALLDSLRYMQGHITAAMDFYTTGVIEDMVDSCVENLGFHAKSIATITAKDDPRRGPLMAKHSELKKLVEKLQEDFEKIKQYSVTISGAVAEEDDHDNAEALSSATDAAPELDDEWAAFA